jgi:NAD(P)-dependent dehydrogenase (short-subunit alcohol dehydrogenase family)
MDLTGKVAIVTGSATGIGKACAEAMARAGACVAIDYVGNPANAQGVVDEIKQAGGRALAVESDVSKQDQVHHLVD